MTTKSTTHLASFVAVVLLVFAGAASGSAQAGKEYPSSFAWYEGKIIDLAESWEGAQACLVGDTNICFRTEADLDAYVEKRESVQASRSQFGLLATCSSPVRLWDGQNKTGQSITLSQRGLILSLSTWGFANRAESYTIGACSSIFRSGSSAVYPGSTSAWASANSMGSWNNKIASVYIA